MLPSYLQNAKDVGEMVKYLQEFLIRRDSPEKIYFHEGTHRYYFRKIHPPAKFIPPRIWYDSQTGRYFPLKGAVSTEAVGSKCHEARLLALAKAAVSGGIMLAIRNLQNGASPKSVLSEIGDDADKDDFRTSCEVIRRNNPDLPEFDADKLWHDARIEILPDFLIQKHASRSMLRSRKSKKSCLLRFSLSLLKPFLKFPIAYFEHQIDFDFSPVFSTRVLLFRQVFFGPFCV
jgi:hypothetical protein